MILAYSLAYLITLPFLFELELALIFCSNLLMAGVLDFCCCLTNYHKLKTAYFYYHTASMGQGSGHSLAYLLFHGHWQGCK